MSYDVIVLGGGPGGYVAAERAGQAGLKTLLIEQRALGGTCLNEGCIPSKVLLNSAKIYHYTTEYGRKFGVVCQGSHVDQPAVVARKEKVIHTLVSGVGAAMKASHVEVVNASGMIRGRGDEGIQVEADGKVYTGKNLIIATGSRAFVPPIPGVKEGLASGFVMTNREALALKELPRRLAVIGGGVIGLELAAYYGVVGCETTVIEMMPKIAGPIDDEISALLQKGYEKDGMKFCLKSKVVRIDADGVVYEKDGREEKVLCDKVLLAIGRKPVADTCGVGEVAVNTILGKKDRMRYKAIPSVLYTNPEVACVGMTEEQAKAAGIDAVTVKLPMAYAGRYVAENEGPVGIAKFVFDKKYRTLVGAHVMSNYSSEFILACAVMIEKEMTVDAIREIVYPHPSVSEIIREAAFAVKL